METMKNERPPRRRGKKNEFTAVDTVVLLFVLLTVFGAVFGWVYQTTNDERDLEREVSYAVVFRVGEIHRDVVNGLSDKDALYVAEDDCLVGYLNGTLTAEDETDTSDTDLVSATGNMICTGNMTGGSLKVGGTDRVLTPGDILYLRTERVIFTIEILEITLSGM